MYSGNTLCLTRLEKDFAELNFNNCNGSANKFDQETLGELEAALGILSSAANIRGLLLTSSKRVFIAGGDITQFKAMFPADKAQFFEAVQRYNRLMSTIEDFPFPSVAVISGLALGGGLEISLACDYRIMADNAAIGLPEINLGILPGWGGTVRLPRLCGFATAVQWITSGKQQKATVALEEGVVDAVFPADQLRKEALSLLDKMTNGTVDFSHRRQCKLSPMSEPEHEIAAIAKVQSDAIIAKTGDYYPAPLTVIELMGETAKLPRDEAIAMETRAFYKLSQSYQARALVGLFLGDQYVTNCAKGYSLELGQNLADIAQAGVVGAGIMGGGIAYQNAISGYSVVMKDIAQEALDMGLEQADRLLQKSVSRGKLASEQADSIKAMITPTLEDVELADCEILVEAVVEQTAVKQTVLCSLEAQIMPQAIIASNTSTISINRLASSLQRPEQFCGMHFFNPVNAMKLVEVIRGEHTSDKTIARVCNYALQLGKKPIVVNDCPGFLVNRVLFALCFGLEMLLKEGVSYEQIDSVMEDWGMPMGPAYLMDVIGLDTINHCYAVMMEGIPERFVRTAEDLPTEALFKVGRLGQKNALGYYKYEKSQRGRALKMPDPEVIQLLESIGGPAKDIEPQDIIDRLLLPLAMEMAHCLEEGIVASATEADMALIWGIGFPAFRGGICRWMDEQGLDSICQRGEAYLTLGELYRPPPQLKKMVASGKRFYS